jgi:two-component system, NarL family, sensor kinase
VLLLIIFIVTILFLYQKRQHKQEKELATLKDVYEQEVLRSQLEIQENTFKNIGQELHDNIGQLLSVVKLSLSGLPIEKEHPSFEPLLHTKQILNQALADMSSLTKSLHTDRVTMVGLTESIKLELNSLSKSGLIKVDFSAIGDEYDLDKQTSIFLFRIFQEVANNILKHAQATTLSVLVAYEPAFFLLEIADDGIGFDVEEKNKSSTATRGVGLTSMHNRAQLIGANFILKSIPNAGTTVTIELPLKPPYS